jgi:hypothetical protein
MLHVLSVAVTRKRSMKGTTSAVLTARLSRCFVYHSETYYDVDADMNHLPASRSLSHPALFLPERRAGEPVLQLQICPQLTEYVANVSVEDYTKDLKRCQRRYYV